LRCKVSRIFEELTPVSYYPGYEFDKAVNKEARRWKQVGFLIKNINH